MNKRLIIPRIVITIILTCIALYFTSGLVERKTGRIDYDVFFEKPTEYDVLFFGPSVVRNAIYPMQLWNDYGITSYNMANDSERIPTTYYCILNALDYSSPKVIFVDLTALAWYGSYRSGTPIDHYFLDNVSLSKNKIAELDDIFDKEDRAEYIVPFSLYHSRWSELEYNDFPTRPRSYYYGSNPGFMSEPTIKADPSMYEESRFGDMQVEEDYLSRIVSLCENRGVKLVFTHMINGHRGGDQKLREFARDFSNKHNVDYYDLLYVDFIDWDKDFIDGAHLNYYGGVKMTDYYGQILSGVYGVPNHHEDNLNVSASWSNDYIAYNEWSNMALREEFDAGNITEDTISLLAQYHPLQ